MTTESKLREALRAEASRLDPSPDGYRAITEGVARRRTRLLWQRAALGLVAVVAVITGGVVVNDLLTSPTRLEEDFAPPGRSPSMAPPPGPIPAPAPIETRLSSVWPFTWQSEVDRWRGDPEIAPALRAANTAAQAFVNRVLPDAATVVVAERCKPPTPCGSPDQESAAFVLTAPRELPASERQEVGVLELRRFGDDGPWLVTSLAGSQGLVISAPGAMSRVSSPLTVGGSVAGVHQSIRVDVLDVSIQPSQVLGTTQGVMAGAEQPWRTSVSFTRPSTTAGIVLATMRSDRDGSLASASAVTVDVAGPPGPSIAPNPTRAPRPASFVGVDDGRLAVFESTKGKRLRYLSELQPGGGSHDAQISDDGRTVVYAQGAGTCASGIHQVSVDGGPATELVDASNGAAMRPTLSADGKRLAYVLARCADGGTGIDVIVRDIATRRERVVQRLTDVDLRGPISWSADGTKIVYVVSHGESAPELVISPATGGSSIVKPSAEECTWQTATWKPGSETIVAAQLCTDGGRTQTELLELDARGAYDTRLLSIDDTAVQALDYDRLGAHLLIWYGGASVTGPIYHWDGSGSLRPNYVAQGPQFPSWS